MEQMDYILSYGKEWLKLFLTIFIHNALGETKYHKISLEVLMYVATFDQLGIAEFCTKQEIIYVIA